MSQIKQLLLLHQQGKGNKTIARLLGMSRATVKVCLQKLQLLTSSAKGTKPFSVAELVKLEDLGPGSQVSFGKPSLQRWALRNFQY